MSGQDHSPSNQFNNPSSTAPSFLNSMNFFQMLNATMATAAIAAVCEDFVGIVNEGGRSEQPISSSMIMFIIFFILFRLKIFLDDHDHFKNMTTMMVEGRNVYYGNLFLYFTLFFSVIMSVLLICVGFSLDNMVLACRLMIVAIICASF